MPDLEVKAKINKAYKFLREYGPRWEVVYGGAGSGKSYAVAQGIILGCLEYPKRKYLCVRKVATSLRYSIYALIAEIIGEMGLNSYFEANKTELSFRCATGARIMLLGLDDPEKTKSIHGITDVWIEEANEFTEQDVEQLNLRVRGGEERKRLVLTFNPILNTHWLKRHFFDTPIENVHITKTTYLDNAFLDAEYKAELEALKDRDFNLYQIYTLGIWGELGQGVFTRFVVEEFPYGEADLSSVGQGVDFGFNHASACIRMGMRDGELYVFDEFYRKGLTNRELIDAVKEWDVGYASHLYVGDSSEPARIKDFTDAGFRMVPAVKGKGSLKDGVDFIRSMQVHVHRTRCPHLAAEMPAYQYRVEKTTGERIDEFMEFNDDCIAALRYAVEPIRLQWKPRVKGFAFA